MTKENFENKNLGQIKYMREGTKCNPVQISWLFLFVMVMWMPSIAHAQTDTSQNRSFLKCYTSFSTAMMLSNMLTPYSVDLTDPDIKGFFSNVCNFVHEKNGIWPNISDDPNSFEYDFNEFLSKYYPYGMPDSVAKLKELGALSELGK